MKRVVIISDLHLHPWAAFAQGSGVYNTRLKHTLRVLEASLSQAVLDRCPWIFGGDWVHTIGKVRNDVLNALITTLNSYDCGKYTVWGNHDARSRGGRIGLYETVVGALLEAVPSLHLLAAPRESEEGSQGYVAKSGGLLISGASYQPDGDVFPDLVGFLSDIGVYHQTVQGTSNASGYKFPGGLSRSWLLDHHGLSVVGDVHHPQVLMGSGEWVPDDELVLDLANPSSAVLIPGSPEHHNFGDKGPHGFWIVDLEDDGEGRYCAKRLEMRRSESPRFVTVDYPEDVAQGGKDFYRVRNPDQADDIVLTDRQTVEANDPQRVMSVWLDASEPDLDRDVLLDAGRALLEEAEIRTPVSAVLRRVRLSNFLSYEDFTFTPARGHALVLGANGAGKTTIFDAIYWALFGKNTKGLSADDVRRWDAEGDCVVELEVGLTSGHGEADATLMVKRTRGKRNTLEAWVDDGANDHPIEGSSVKDVQDKVTGMLGLTPEIFHALCYYSQERVFLFSRATDAERKTMLADMLGLSAYSDASKAARAAAQDWEQQASRHGATLEVLERESNDASTQLMKAHESHDGWDLEHAQKLAKLGEALKAATRQREEEVRAVEEALAALGLSDDDKWKVDQLKELRTSQAEVREMLRSHQARMTSLPGEVKQAEAAITQLDGFIAAARAGKCGVCGQVWSASADKVPEWEASKSSWESHVSKLRAEGQQTEAAIGNLEEQLQLLDALIPRLEQYQQLLDKWNLLRQTQGPNEAAAAQAIRDAEQETNPWAKYIEDWGSKVERLGQDVAATKKKQQDADFGRAVYDFWAKGFGREGVQSLLLDDLARSFNAARTRVFPLLTRGTYDVQFSTQATTKAGSVRERTEFVVIKDGVRRPYESSSGGQRTRIDVGVMFTLLLAVCETLQVPGILGTLVLDEVLGWIDDEGAEAFADMIGELTETIPSVYVISHDDSLKGLIPTTIHVEQDEEGISHVARV